MKRSVCPASLLNVITCVDIYITTHIWRALFHNAISVIPKIELAITMPMLEIVFHKRALHKYEHVCAYIHMWKVICQHSIYKLGIDIWNPFLGMVLMAFWKRALYMHMSVPHPLSMHVLVESKWVVWLSVAGTYLEIQYY